jgi:hypothetical protein
MPVVQCKCPACSESSPSVCVPVCLTTLRPSHSCARCSYASVYIHPDRHYPHQLCTIYQCTWTLQSPKCAFSILMCFSVAFSSWCCLWACADRHAVTKTSPRLPAMFDKLLRIMPYPTSRCTHSWVSCVCAAVLTSMCMC